MMTRSKTPQKSKSPKGPYAVFVALALMCLKSTVFQTQAMEPEFTAQTEQGVAFNKFDALLAQTPTKTVDEMFNEMEEISQEAVIDGFKLGLGLLPFPKPFISGIFELLCLESKGIVGDIYREQYKNFTEDQLKILYTYVTSPCSRTIKQTEVQQATNALDYLRYGIARYNNDSPIILEGKQWTRQLEGIRKLLTFILGQQEAYISHFRSVDLKTHPWDGTIPDAIWSLIKETKYPEGNLIVNYDVFTDAQKKNIVDHSAYKYCYDLAEMLPEELQIKSNFMEKYESIDLSMENCKEVVIERIQTIVDGIIQKKMKELEETIQGLSQEEFIARYGDAPKLMVTVTSRPLGASSVDNSTD